MSAQNSNKLIVITGASSGIGEAAAALFHSKGYKLLLLARRLEKMQEIMTKYSLTEKDALIAECDITKVEEVRKAIEHAQDHFQIQVDCLINNAGVMYLQPLSEQSLERQETMISTNVNGILNCTNVVLKSMLQRQTGTIINISSIAGKKSFGNHVAYCGTKFAVHGMTEALRSEVSGSKVRVIIIAPGVTQTELLGHNDKDQVDPYEEWKKTMTLGVLKSDDVASAILYAYEAPAHVCIREIALAPTEQRD